MANNTFNHADAERMSFIEKVTALMNVRTAEVARLFETDPILTQYDRIIVPILGGLGGGIRAIKTALDRYPVLRQKLMVLRVDYEIDPRELRPGWGQVNLGQMLDGRVGEIIRERGVPSKGKFFSAAAVKHIDEIAKGDGSHSYVNGAAMDPVLGALGVHYLQEELKSFLYDYLYELFEKQNLKNILIVPFLGSSGGTGWGIAPQFISMIGNVGKSIGIPGMDNINPVVMAWGAYQNIAFQVEGLGTITGPKLWERSRIAYDNAKGAFFVASEMGPDSFLAMLSIAAEHSKPLNNSKNVGAHENALVRFEEMTPWRIARIAGAHVLRRESPKDPMGKDNCWRIHKPGLFNWSTWAEYLSPVPEEKSAREGLTPAYLSEALYWAETAEGEPEPNWKLALRHACSTAGIQIGDLSNLRDLGAQISAHKVRAETLLAQLQRVAGGNGLFLVEGDEPFEPAISRLPLSSILTQRAGIDATLPFPPSMVAAKTKKGDQDLSQVQLRKPLIFGSVRAHFEIVAKIGKRPHEDILEPPLFTLSNMDRAELRKLDALNDAGRRMDRGSSVWENTDE